MRKLTKMMGEERQGWRKEFWRTKKIWTESEQACARACVRERERGQH